MSSKVALLISSEDNIRNCNDVCLRIDSDTSLEGATTRVFIVGRKFTLSALKKLATLLV